MLSFAKFQTSDFVTEKSKSLINILKKTSTRIEAYGTPVLILYHDLNADLF